MKFIKRQILFFAFVASFSFQAFAFVDCREAAKEATYEQKATCGESQVHLARKKPSGDDIAKGITTFRIFTDDDLPLIWDEYGDKAEMYWYEKGEKKSGMDDIFVRDIIFFPGRDNWEVLNAICTKILGDEFKYDYLTASYVGLTYPRFGNATSFNTDHKDGKNISYRAYDWKEYSQYKDSPEFSDQKYVSPQKANMILRSFACRTMTEAEKNWKPFDPTKILKEAQPTKTAESDKKISQEAMQQFLETNFSGLKNDPEKGKILQEIEENFSQTITISFPYMFCGGVRCIVTEAIDWKNKVILSDDSGDIVLKDPVSGKEVLVKKKDYPELSRLIEDLYIWDSLEEAFTSFIKLTLGPRAKLNDKASLELIAKTSHQIAPTLAKLPPFVPYSCDDYSEARKKLPKTGSGRGVPDLDIKTDIKPVTEKTVTLPK